MKDYSTMSDFDIQQAVLHETWGKHPVRLLGKMMLDIMLSDYDPCNNPADAWPILMANHIGIMPFKSGAATAWPTSIGLLSNFHVKHENPLRAAMIVYLMMKDAEKCDG